MCKGDGCPVKAGCHRFTGPKDARYQPYVRPKKIGADGCELFWPTKGTVRE